MGMAAVEPHFHVLAVDDSLIDRKLIERLFRTSSCQVTTVDSGSKALQFLGLSEDNQKIPNQPSVFPNNNQEVHVNLVITDYCMPGMTGYDLLKKIKESSSLRNIPVVIMSSENDPSRISRCLEEGAEEFFLKPVRLSDVNKLRPHMVKNKKAENQESLSSESSSAESGMTDVQSLPRQEQTEESQQSKANDNSCNNKRKAIEESFVLKRTRPRCSGLTAFSDL